jgi:hypothetical protein
LIDEGWYVGLPEIEITRPSVNEDERFFAAAIVLIMNPYGIELGEA